MAYTDKDSTVLSQSSEKEGNGPVGANEEYGRIGLGGSVAADSHAVANTDTPSISGTHMSTASVDAKPNSNPVRPSLVQLGSNHTQGSSAASPHPKRFSAVNINKKFLEKNSSTSGPSPVSPGSPATKSGTPISRPQVQSSSSHSRLVTTKLTSTSPASSTGGAGWSRPSSVAPPNTVGSQSPNNNPPLLPAVAPGTTSTNSGASHPPHTGKLIQPQPRAVVSQQGSSHKDVIGGTGSNKPVWGNVKSTAPAPRPNAQQNDFPTAAEVAQVSSTRMTKAAETAAANKQARMEEADTFRGVHLDPNAHHWDEMEEDDDNFLDGVIEFGDGRQYKIESTDIPKDSPQLSDSFSHPPPKAKYDITPSKDPAASPPVSKEERFADDFDRSWPRSRTSPTPSMRDMPPAASQGPITGAASTLPVSPVIPQTLHSPQESSRVLFNERSNRLEPYSNSHRPGMNQHLSKRGGLHDFSVSPTESRNTRDLPASSTSSNTVQLLQKPGSADATFRSRRFSGGSSGPGHTNNRDHPSRRDGPPPSPRISRDNYSVGLPGKGGDINIERGRRSAMGPPPLPVHSYRDTSKDSGRQLPPHFSSTPQGRLPSQDSRPQSHPIGVDSNVSPSTRRPSQSPALSHASAARISPALTISSLPQLSAPELDVARKDVMQSAAARAKQRRQLEEEEREREKERARRKAAELEERMKLAEAEKAKEAGEMENSVKSQKDEEAIAIIEEAIKSVEVTEVNSATTHHQHSISPSSKIDQRRASLLTSVPVQSSSDSALSSAPRKTSTSTPVVATSTLPAVKADSWRSKAGPLPPLSTAQQTHTRTPIPSFLPPPPLEQVKKIAENPEENLEVVDFSDMGKFIGVPDSSDRSTAERPNVMPSSRPVASDFFDEASPSVEAAAARNGANSTRRQNQPYAPGNDLPLPSAPTNPTDSSSATQNDTTDNPLGLSTTSTILTKEPPMSTEHTYQTVLAPPHVGNQRTPRTGTFYKEAAMSALDDAMSRIKGALDGMQASEHAKEIPSTQLPEPENLARPIQNSSSQKERWIPPALRPRNFDIEAPEVFHVTGAEPPQSPAPTRNAFVIKLPTSSPSMEPVNRKQLHLFSKPSHQVRWDTLSFDPPVEGMSRRDFSLNDVLFRRQPGGYRGKPRYRVVLPRFRLSASGPRVNIPIHPYPSKPNGGGAFGRPTNADGLTSWRKVAPPKLDSSDLTSPQHGLDTMSRSPPPDTLTDSNATPITSPSGPTKTDGSRSRLQPKMPAGSAVAFYRDSRIDAVEAEPKPLVNFIVTSELEESRQESSHQATPTKARPNITVTSPPHPQSPASHNDQSPSTKSMSNGITASPSIEHTTPSLIHGKAESKSSDDSVDRVPITPPSHFAAPWARTPLSNPLKESPARAPDPEHLKAVWSQTSNKAGLHAINSLEGIADDLTALPFTLQDVKSEDGETPPPPASSAPSRMSMSLHEVTRAFQQVPSSTSSSSTSHRTPPLTAPPPSRPSNYSYGLPPPHPNNIRPPYASYPSPMMSHSPSPSVIYPHAMSTSPVPNRLPVNGHTPLYSQPMWMSMPGPPPQNQPNMMRPMTSPYPTQLIAYPATPTMYAPQPLATMQNNPQQQNGSQLNRSRSMTMMSPVIPHAQMYGSPVLMHAPVMQPPNGYVPVPAGRGQMRTDTTQLPMQQHSQQTHHQLPPHSGYNPVPSSSFARPTW